MWLWRIMEGLKWDERWDGVKENRGRKASTKNHKDKKKRTIWDRRGEGSVQETAIEGIVERKRKGRKRYQLNITYYNDKKGILPTINI